MQAVPGGAGRAVFDADAQRSKLLTQGIGTGKVACRAGGLTGGYQGINVFRCRTAGVALTQAALLAPMGRVLLQQAEQVGTVAQGGEQA